MATTPLLPHTVLNTLIWVPPSCFSDVTSSLSHCCSWRMDLNFIVPHGEIPFHSTITLQQTISTQKQHIHKNTHCKIDSVNIRKPPTGKQTHKDFGAATSPVTTIWGNCLLQHSLFVKWASVSQFAHLLFFAYVKNHLNRVEKLFCKLNDCFKIFILVFPSMHAILQNVH